MSKPVKELLRKELLRRLEGVTSLAIVGFTGLDAIATNRIRGRLRKKDIRITVVKNALARQVFKIMGLDTAIGLLDGPCAVAYGSDSVVTIVRELLDIGKGSPELVVKAAIFDGQPFGQGEVEALSRFPNRAEAISRLAACVLSPGARVAACVIGPGARVAALVKAIQERLEKAACPAGGEETQAA